MNITVICGSMSAREQDEYLAFLKKEHPDKIITDLEIRLDGEFVDLNFKYETVPFQRIRRITGYLVGTLDRFNNAKRREVNDRLKHE